MSNGRVIFLSPDRRFGFVQSEAGTEVVFYTRDKAGPEPLHVGDSVDFDVTTRDGTLVAIQLSRVPSASPVRN